MKMTLILFWVVKFCLSSHTYLWLPYYMHHCIFHKLCFINFPYSFWCLLQTCCDVIELPVIYPSCRLLSPSNCLLWLPFTRKEIAPTYSYWPLLQNNYAPPQQLFLNSPFIFSVLSETAPNYMWFPIRGVVLQIACCTRLFSQYNFHFLLLCFSVR